MKVTLDWNCIIEVEEGRGQQSEVLKLVQSHRAGKHDVGLLAASASENTKSMRFPGNGHLFSKRIRALRWDDLPIVPMPCIYGLSYFDFCYSVEDGERYEKKFSSLWEVIAGKVNYDPKSYLAANEALTDEVIQSQRLSKWRNAWCDVMSAYCHINERRDVFVTLNTRDFQNNASELAKRGMNEIREPKEVTV